ncbi:hypothetical protein GA0115256_12949 [Streptomyces sp. DconLS]|nr:hypothetical protein GA0115256_12949 [Streptomyces sp. DconLS]
MSEAEIAGSPETAGRAEPPAESHAPPEPAYDPAAPAP